MMAETMRFDYTTEHRTTMTRTSEDSRRRFQQSGAAPVRMINAIHSVQGMSEGRTTVCGATPARKEE